MNQYPFRYTSNPGSYHLNQRDEQNMMTLEGKGKIIATPDLFVINLGVMTEDIDVVKAQQENAEISNQVIQRIKNIGVQETDIKTITYTIQPQYQYNEGKSTLRGFQVQHLFEITVREIDQAGTIYDLAVGAGANIAGDTQFKLTNYDSIYQKALQLALKNSQEKANKLAQQLRVNVNPIPIKISEQNVSIPFREVSRPYSLDLSIQSPTPIQKGELEVEAIITAVYQYMNG